MEDYKMIKHVESLEEFKEATKEGRVLVDFFATWCGPCRMVAPILEELDADENFNVQIVKVDVDEAGDIAMMFGIQSIPTLIYFEGGKSIRKNVGFMRKDQILEFVK